MAQGRKQYLLKVIVIGDSGVGKTNLITRFCQNNFKDTYVATIGVDFKIKSLPINDKKIKMQIWDTAGQERFKNITQTYYKGASGIVLAYSTNDAKSFENIQKWIVQIENHAPDGVSKILVATKQDLDKDRCVSIEEGRDLATRHGIQFMEVSAKTGYQVKDVFEALAREMEQTQIQNGAFKAGIFNEKREILRSTPGEPQRNCAC